jgi:hypothetical protein
METDYMGMTIKYWTKAVDSVASTLTKAGKPRKRKVTATAVRKATDSFVEVEKPIEELGITVEFWDDPKNEDQVENILQSIPGIIYTWGVHAQRN